MSNSYDLLMRPRDLERRIRFMTDAELNTFHEEVRNHSHLKLMEPRIRESLLDEIARVQNERKRNELRDAMILFFAPTQISVSQLMARPIGWLMQ